MSGTKNPAQARVSRAVSSAPFSFLATLTLRLRWPWGARITTITTLAMMMAAFASQGFMAGKIRNSPSQVETQARPVTIESGMVEDHDFELDGFLARPLIAHLASDAPDGPRNSPLWFQWEDRALWFIGTARDS